MSTYALTIAGAAKTFDYASLAIAATVNGRHTLTCDITSLDASYRPALDDEVVLTEDGTRIFGGVITRTVERSKQAALGQDAIVTQIVCSDFSVYADRRYANESVASGTLKAALTVLVNNYLDDYGISLDAGQANGATLEALEWDYRNITDILNELATVTGWVWRIDYSKKLKMFDPTGEAAPFDLTDGGAEKAIGDVQVEPQRGDYYNRVILKAGTNAVVEKSDAFVGDGSTTAFTLTYPMVYIPVVGRGYVINEGVYETLDLSGQGATWVYDPGANTITRTSAPANLNDITITYDAQFPITVIANNTTEQGTYGIYEKVITAPDIFDKAQAQDIADGLLAQGILQPKVVTYATYEPGVFPGQTQTITLAGRDVDGDFLITEVQARSGMRRANLLRDVKAIEATRNTRTWRSVYKDWIAASTSGGTTIRVSSGGGEGGGSPFNLYGNGNPQSVVTAAPGSIYVDIATGYVYRKMVGSGNTGWYYVPPSGPGAVLGPSYYEIIGGDASDGEPSMLGFFENPNELNNFSAVALSDGIYNYSETNTTPGTRAGWNTEFFMSFWDFNFDLVIKLATHTTISNARIWFGLTNSGSDIAANSDNAADKAIAFRYSTNVPDGGWVGYTRDGTTASVTSTVASIATSTIYTLRIRFVRSGTPTVYFSVNDGVEVSKTSNIPATGVGAAIQYYVKNVSTTQLRLYYRRCGVVVGA